MRKYICGVIISVLIMSVSPCNYIYAESVDVSGEETVTIDQNNPNPVLFDNYGLQIQWDSCKYTEGASDITLNLHITNDTGSIIGITFDDLQLDDSYIEMNDSRTYDAGKNVYSTYYIKKDNIKSIAKEDFNNLSCIIKITADEQLLKEIPMVAERAAFESLKKIPLTGQKDDPLQEETKEEEPSESSENTGEAGKENERFQEENAELSKENDSLTKENDSLKKENDGLKKENDGLKEENDSLKEENDGLKEENNSLKEENDSLTKENENLAAEIKELEAEKTISSESEEETAAVETASEETTVEETEVEETTAEETASNETEEASEIAAVVLPDNVANADTVTEYSDKATVRLVQQTLNELGFNCGNPDGVAGTNTKSAITAYETEKGLVVNGIITDQLLESLEIADEIEEQAKIEASKAEYSSEYTYEQLARNPDTYKYKKVKYTGKVLQAETGDVCYARVAMNNSYDTILFVTYDSKLLDYRLLEDDRITIYGTVFGTYSYKAVSGAMITLPWIDADIIELQ